MAIKYFVKAAVSEYQDDKGNSKKRYQTIGTVFETKHGLMVSLESLPLLALKDGKLMAYLNEPDDSKVTVSTPVLTKTNPPDGDFPF